MPTFSVPGVPIAKGRPRATTISGHARMYTPEKTMSYEAKVADCARLAGVTRMEGPVALTVVAVWPCRKKTKRHQPREPKVTKPDGDNVFKAVADALIGVAYDDDSCVTRMICEKWYGATGELPRVDVGLREHKENKEVCY